MSRRTDKPEFERLDDRNSSTILAEFAHLLRHNRKYWMIPVVGMLLVLGLLIILGGSQLAPFVYALF